MQVVRLISSRPHSGGAVLILRKNAEGGNPDFEKPKRKETPDVLEDSHL